MNKLAGNREYAVCYDELTGTVWDALHHASDYFEQLYAWAEHLIGIGKAYVDDTPPDQMRTQRGTRESTLTFRAPHFS